MDEGWAALALLFLGLLMIAGALFYYMAETLSGNPYDPRVVWGIGIAGVALFIAGGTLWRRGVPKK